MNDKDSQRYRANLQGEVDGAAVYRALGDSESDPKLAEVFRRLAAVEEAHAEFWRSRLGDQARRSRRRCMPACSPGGPPLRARLRDPDPGRNRRARDRRAYDDQAEARAPACQPTSARMPAS